MEYCKLQLGCLLIVLYIGFLYYKEIRRFRQKHRFAIFDGFLLFGVLCIVFDGLTAYTVNHLESVSRWLNMGLHMMFLLSIDILIFLLFIYMLSITTGLPKEKVKRWLLYVPLVINLIIVIVNMPTLEYREGALSNYSMGTSAYTCFIMAGVYIILAVVTFFRRWNYIVSHKRWSIFTYLMILVGTTGFQMAKPQSLVSSIAVTAIIIGIYLNHENPSVKELSHYHSEMVMGFATLVENKDGSTGGHIKRTTAYVKLLSEELQKRGHYKDVLTKDYMRNLAKAAPMHDIGKISVPDVILQKPGKLTDEEFDRMKLHTVSGGEIIQETFGHVGDEAYAKMAYEVARYHHEKWNGRGYPEGLKRKEIPLSARIMAIADVFDAVSEKRCYRDAMPLDKCFEIISDGSGQDFDPLLAEIFLEIREKVEETYYSIGGKRDEQ